MLTLKAKHKLNQTKRRKLAEVLARHAEGGGGVVAGIQDIFPWWVAISDDDDENRFTFEVENIHGRMIALDFDISEKQAFITASISADLQSIASQTITSAIGVHYKSCIDYEDDGDVDTHVWSAMRKLIDAMCGKDFLDNTAKPQWSTDA